MATDPVCGMFVEERPDALSLVRGNRTYYFCSRACLRQFARPEEELRGLRRKLAVAWPLSLAVVLLTYSFRFPDAPWVAFALATGVEFYPGLQFFAGALDAARSRSWNMDVLIAVGTGAAYAYSAAALFLPGRLPPAYYFDASSLIVSLILTGNYLEHFTRERARGSLRRLQEALPTSAQVVGPTSVRVVPVSEVRVGDLVRVLPGGRFPVDGTVAEGVSSVNEALLTGESVPQVKGPGSSVVAGAINGEGRLDVRASRVGEDTALAQIGELVTEAETSRVPLQALADRIAAAFVPLVLALAFAATLAWWLLGVGPALLVLVLVSVVITACPCAFAIATPAAIVVGTGRAAEEGILFKGGDSLERASQVDVVLSDKTGTLTSGTPSLAEVVLLGESTEESVLLWAAAVEQGSDHPFARAVVEAARARRLNPPPATRVQAVPGAGVRGTVAGEEVSVLRGVRPAASGAAPSDVARVAADLESRGEAWATVARNGVDVGVLGFREEVHPEVPSAVRALASDGIPVVLVTGDHEAAARAVARAAGIEEVHSAMDPASKLGLIRRFQAAGRRVAFVGDGINDGPALAAADLGIAVTGATGLAQEASGVVLLRADFRAVASALRLGRRTVAKVRGNLAWAVGYNAFLLPVAMGALVPALGLKVFLVLPVTGALAMAVSSTLVVLNSLSLRWVRLG